MTNEIMEIYKEDTVGRKYHQNIVTKNTNASHHPPESEVITFKYDRPILYKEFIKLTPEHRRFYLTYVCGKYKISRKTLAEAMQVSHNTLGWQFHYLNIKTKKMKKESTKTISEFLKWWNGNNEPIEQLPDEHNAPAHNEHIEEKIIPQIPLPDISEFNITLSGIDDISSLSKMLSFVNKDYTVTINVRKINN